MAKGNSTGIICQGLEGLFARLCHLQLCCLPLPPCRMHFCLLQAIGAPAPPFLCTRTLAAGIVAEHPSISVHWALSTLSPLPRWAGPVPSVLQSGGRSPLPQQEFSSLALLKDVSVARQCQTRWKGLRNLRLVDPETPARSSEPWLFRCLLLCS